MVNRSAKDPVGYGILYEGTSDAMKFPFWFRSVGRYEGYPGFFTTRDGRADYQLIQTVSGRAKLTVGRWSPYGGGTSVGGGSSCELRAGSVVLIDCMKLHDYRTLGDEDWIYQYIHFAGTSMAAYAPLLSGAELPSGAFYPRDISAFDDVFQLLFKNQLRNDPASNARACAIIADLLSRLMDERYALAQSVDDPVNGTSTYGVVSQAIEYIKHNYNREISLDELASEAHLSKYHFARVFKRGTNLPPYQYVTQYRIRQAKLMLGQTHNADVRMNVVPSLPSVGRIAAEVGYQNVNQFILHFKRLTGVTPSAYRDATRALSRGLASPP